MSSDELALVRKYISIYGISYLENPNCDFLIEDTALSVKKDVFGDQWAKAVALKTLHYLYLSTKPNETGSIIASKTMGPVSFTFANEPSKGRNSLNMSIYGKMYNELVNSCVTGMSVTGL